MSGLVYVFTGEGKGKTSAALGVAVRSLLNNEKVGWISFYKQETWGIAEAKLKNKFANLEMYFVGKGFRITKYDKKLMKAEKELKLASVGNGAKVVDTASEDEHKEAARMGIEIAKQMIDKKPFLVVLDEIINAIDEGLVDEQILLDLIAQRGEVNLVLTGRGISKKVKQASDLATECKKIKHPFDLGRMAVKGLDY